MSLDHAEHGRLADWLRQQAAAGVVHVHDCKPIGGGAVQDNRLLEVTFEGGQHAGHQQLVLRLDAASQLAISHSRRDEFRLLRAAFAHGIRVPEPLWCCEDTAVLGQAFFVMRCLPGVADGRQLVKLLDEQAGDALVEALGGELARIHALPDSILPGASAPPESPVASMLAQWRDWLDGTEQPQPVLEWAMRWLALNAPADIDMVVSHQDFRTGNLLVEQGRLAGVLDWEFADWNARGADLGWFCAPCWRFGREDREAGGLGTKAAFLRGYQAVSGVTVDNDSLRYWEIMATLRWAIIALQQAERHHSGAQPDLELALTGHLLPALELDLLRLVPGKPPAAADESSPASAAGHGEMKDPTLDLLSIARRALKEQVIPQLDGDGRYPALMVANALSVASRQYALGQTSWTAERARLAELLGAPDNGSDPRLAQQLIEEIRSGWRDDVTAFETLRQVLRDEALERAEVSQPVASARERARLSDQTGRTQDS